MPTLTIGNHDVEVDDGFLKLSPDEQNATVDHIANSLKQSGVDLGGHTSMADVPELPADRASGLTGRAAVQAAPGALLGLPAMAYDAVANLPRYLTKQAYNAVARPMGWQETPLNDPMATTHALSQVGQMGADALGLPQPETPGERIAVSGGQAALEALGGAGLAKAGAKVTQGATQAALKELGTAPVAQTVMGGLGGAGAQTAAEMGYSPLAGMAAGLALGWGPAAAAAGARAGIQAGRQAADRALARTPEIQQQLANERIYNAASNPADALRNIQEGAGGELVPGSKPTTFQATGDMGLGSFERDLQTANPEVFAQRRADQNSARLGTLQQVQGQGNPQEVVAALRNHLDQIDKATAGQEAGARTAAEAAAEKIQPSDTAEGIGGSIRGSMKDAETAARARESALWNAVDPDGTLTASTQPAKQTVQDLYGKMTQSARLGLSGGEKAIADLVQSFRPIESFRELTDLSSQIKAAMRDELSTRGRTPTYARLSQLNQAVRNGIETSAAERIASDPVAGANFQAYRDVFEPAGSGQGVGADNLRYGTLSQSGFPGVAGEEAAAGRQVAPSAGGSGVQGPNGGQATFTAQQLREAIRSVTGHDQPINALNTKQGQAVVDFLNSSSRSAPSAPRSGGRPLSLTQFIAKNGGLPLDAEAAARDWGNVSVGRFGKLARPDGRSVDGYWRNKLIDAGYLPKDADGYASRDITKELYDAIENERAGRKTFTASDEMQGAGSHVADGPEAEYQSAARQIREELGATGVHPSEISNRALNDAAEMLARGEEKDAITAYERAVMNLEDEGPVRAQYAPQQGSSAGSLLDGFKEDPEAAKRYKAATEATRERVGTYNKGYAGQILRQGEDRQSFRMGDSSVTANAFRPGPTGGERIKALVKAGAKMSDLADAASLSLNKTAMRSDGTLDPAKFQRWRSSFAEALREMPEDVRARFANASLATQALEKAAGARKTALNEFNKSILGRLAGINPDDMPKEIGGILNARDGAAKMAQIVRTTAGNQAAREGLRRAVAEYIETKFISNKEVGTSNENAIKANAFATFVREKAPILKQVFSGPDLLRMQSIAEDIKRSERSLYAVKTPGQSNTAQDVGVVLDKAAEKAGKGSVLSQMMKAGAVGLFAGGPKGAAAGAGGAWAKDYLGAMRAAGMQKVDDLVLEMMLDPQLGKVALMHAPISDKSIQRALTASLGRLSGLAAVTANQALGSQQPQ